TEDFNRVQRPRMRQRGHAHLEADAREAAQRLVQGDDFFRDGVGRADEVRAGGAERMVELRARRGRPAALPADLGEALRPTRKEFVRGALVAVGQVTDGVHADLQLLRGKTGAATGLAVEFDQRTEAVWLA